jgi:hypothetical protein
MCDGTAPHLRVLCRNTVFHSGTSRALWRKAVTQSAEVQCGLDGRPGIECRAHARFSVARAFRASVRAARLKTSRYPRERWDLSLE